MPDHSSSVTTTSSADASAVMSIKTRFGEVTVDTTKAVLFPRGLLGMPDKQRYAVTSFPTAKMAQFKLLQSLDDHNLSFITLPLEVENSIIAAHDVRAAAADMQINPEQLAILLIVSVHRSPDQVKLSVNARAPIFIDAERRIGVQHVFQNDSYKVQHMFS
ncbi:MAG: flagellar assembly protein FliW [Alphaproteobacteria bacterium]|nr:flagellar assembly protein FliW [Alphaproteobacteria bacterium]